MKIRIVGGVILREAECLFQACLGRCCAIKALLCIDKTKKIAKQVAKKDIIKLANFSAILGGSKTLFVSLA